MLADAKRTVETMLAELGEPDSDFWRGYAKALRDVIKRLPTDFPEVKN